MRALAVIRRPHGGFSLVEAMVTLVVLSVGMIGIAALYGEGLAASRLALYRTVAVNLTADMAERIRADRIAGAAYDGTGADNHCTSPGSAICSPAQMAADDLFDWNQTLARALPGGTGTVRFAAGSPPRYIITVAWQETSVGAATHEIEVGVARL